MKHLSKQSGSTNPIAVIAGVILLILAFAFMPSVIAEWRGTKTTDIVLSAAGYNELIDKLDANNALLVANGVHLDDAKAAALLAASEVDFFNTAEVFVYPTTTDRTCTMTSGLADAFGVWAEITDSAATTLSSKFAAKGGYFCDAMVFNNSVPSEMYIIEIAYGAGKTVIARLRVYADWTYMVHIKSRPIPAGETIYYRMAAETAGSTCRIGFNYFLEP
jgi:hypothetical protein